MPGETLAGGRPISVAHSVIAAWRSLCGDKFSMRPARLAASAIEADDLADPTPGGAEKLDERTPTEALIGGSETGD